MTIIIGSITTVNVDGNQSGFQSVQWSQQVQPNRLWQLGSWSPYKTLVTKILQVSITTYAGALNTVSLTPSSSCSNSNATKDISISPGTCGGSVGGFNENGMYLSSYGYSKDDPIGFGQESWSFQKWVDSGVGGTDFISVGPPNFVLLGISEGSKSGNVANLGVTLDNTGVVTGIQGSVSAGFPGVGSVDSIEYGIVTSVGGGSLEDSGNNGKSDASIPHQPLYTGN